MGYITFKSFPEGADLEIEGEPCGQTPAEIKTMCDLLNFRDACMGNNAVTCNWDTLETWLLPGTVGTIWWDLTDTERHSIADTAVRKWTSELIYPNIPYARHGKDHCAGGEGAWGPAVCGSNAIIRCARFGKNCDDVSSCYYRKSDSGDEECCFCEKNYNLPTYPMLCTVPDGSPGHFGHAVAAIHIKPPIDEIASYYMFQNEDCDIHPPCSHIPTSSYDAIDLQVVSPITCGCTGYSYTPIHLFQFINGELI